MKHQARKLNDIDLTTAELKHHFHTYRFFLTGFILSLLLSCKQGGETYVNHDIWKTPEISSPARLRGKPTEIVQRFYVGLTDTTIGGALPDRPHEMITYRFDKDGNLLFTQIILDTLMTTDATYRYDRDGEHYQFATYSTGDTSYTKRVSEKTGSGTFKAVVSRRGEEKYEDRISFRQEGQEVATERWYKGVMQHRIVQFYNGHNLQKEIYNAGPVVRTDMYYYSAKGYLDSIVSTADGGMMKRWVYLNNAKGDPVYYSESDKSGKISEQSMQYLYDDKGNWTRQLNRIDLRSWGRSFGQQQQTKIPVYELFVREIKY